MHDEMNNKVARYRKDNKVRLKAIAIARNEKAIANTAALDLRSDMLISIKLESIGGQIRCNCVMCISVAVKASELHDCKTKSMRLL